MVVDIGAGGLSLGGGLVAKVVNVFGAALGAEATL